LVLPFGVVLAALTAAGSGSAARPLALGLEVPNGTDPHLIRTYDRASLTKVQYVRIVVEWASMNPADGVYSWASLDTRVNVAIAKGLQPYVTVYKAPPWAERGSTGRAGSRDPDPADFGKFATALATHFKNRVDTWEVWNEPNLEYFLMPQKASDGSWYSPVLYRNLLNAFEASVHAVDANATIVAGATAPHRKKLSQPGPLRFMRRMLCLSDTNRKVCSNQSHFDAWSTHPYTSGGPTHHAAAPGDVSLGDLPTMKRVLNAGVAAGNVVSASPSVGFWVGEFSWDSNLPDPKAVPSGLHARWVSEALYRSWRAGVTMFMWFTVRDRSIRTAPYQSGFWYCGRASRIDDGSCDSDSYDYGRDARKLSWRAFYFPFVAYAANGRLTVWGRTPGAQPDINVAIQRRTASGWRTVTTATANNVGIFAKIFRSSLRSGSIRARLSSGAYSLGFSLVRPPDRSVNPFGCGGNIPC
jgi:polysaccharide biosynthesis protein PslG